MRIQGTLNLVGVPFFVSFNHSLVFSLQGLKSPQQVIKNKRIPNVKTLHLWGLMT